MLHTLRHYQSQNQIAENIIQLTLHDSLHKYKVKNSRASIVQLNEYQKSLQAKEGVGKQKKRLGLYRPLKRTLD